VLRANFEALEPFMSAGGDQKGEALLRKLEAAGYERRAPAVLQPASVFLALSGEDVRGRLLLTSDAGGGDYCLRPEFTIPLSLDYLASPRAGQPAAFCCAGPVFRQRASGSTEFPQVGLESFLALALEAAGGAGLLESLLEKLNLPPVWLRRIRSGLAKGRTIAEVVAPVAENGDHSGVLAALDGADKAGARALVEDLLKIAGISALGGRTPTEIAERFLEQAALRSSAGLDAGQRGLLEAFFAIEGQPDKASTRLRALFAAADLDLGSALDRFDQRLNFLAARGVDLDSVVFSAGFARNLDYYTGFVFEAEPAGDATGAAFDHPVVGGGRYDRLLATLGTKADIPAVGAAIWLERLNGAN
jgi:ATP phosphoribosyltransferase regulatory subunit